MKKYLILIAALFIGLTAEAQLVRSSALIVTEDDSWPVKLGWTHIVDSQVGYSWWEEGPIFGIHYIAGYRFSPELLVGIGIGYDYLRDVVWEYDVEEINPAPSMTTPDYWSVTDSPDGGVPLFAHARYYFSTEVWAPYVGASLGMYLSGSATLNEDWNTGTRSAPSTTFYADINAGFNHRLSAAQDLAIYAGIKRRGMCDYYFEYSIDNLRTKYRNDYVFYVGASYSF